MRSVFRALLLLAFTASPLVAFALDRGTKGQAENSSPTKEWVVQGHAHNDYLHDRPLFDALGYGYKSIEIDVFYLPISDRLVVAHRPDLDFFTPESIPFIGGELIERAFEKQHAPTIEELYFFPLKTYLDNTYNALSLNGDPIRLIIDFKTHPIVTYPALLSRLEIIKEFLTHFVWNEEANEYIRVEGLVEVIVSGRPGARPIGELYNDVLAKKDRLIFLDGRVRDSLTQSLIDVFKVFNPRFLKSDRKMGEMKDFLTDPSVAPIVSEMWNPSFRIKSDETIARRIKENIVQKAGGRPVRMWGAPDTTEAWKIQEEACIGYINTDQLGLLKNYLEQSSQNGSICDMELGDTQYTKAD